MDFSINNISSWPKRENEDKFQLFEQNIEKLFEYFPKRLNKRGN